MDTSLSTNKIADLSGISHATARRRLTAGGAVADSDGRYSLREILRAWEHLASGRVGELNATEAKTKLANLKIEEQTIELRRIKGELVELEPWRQYMSALSKCLWVTIQSLGLDQDGLEHCRNEINRVTTEFANQTSIEVGTLQDREDQEAINEQSA
jgi:hypothetical protein